MLQTQPENLFLFILESKTNEFVLYIFAARFIK